MVALLFSPLARWLTAGAVILAVIGGIYLKGRSDGGGFRAGEMGCGCPGSNRTRRRCSP